MSSRSSRGEEATGAEGLGAEGLRSGEVARQVGVSKDTLRFYERRGLLEPPRRTSNNYRLFPVEVVERLRWIRQALAMGFTVEELARILASRARGDFPCREVLSLAAGKLAAVEERLEEMAGFRDGLSALVRAWELRLSNTPPGQPARLLEKGGAGAPVRSARRPRPG